MILRITPLKAPITPIITLLVKSPEPHNQERGAEWQLALQLFDAMPKARLVANLIGYNATCAIVLGVRA